MCNKKVIETNTNVGMSLLVNMIFMKIFNIILIKCTQGNYDLL